MEVPAQMGPATLVSAIAAKASPICRGSGRVCSRSSQGEAIHSGRGMNSVVARIPRRSGRPSSRPWPASMRSLREDTKFHQMWRGPSMAAPPTRIDARVAGRRHRDAVAGPEDEQPPGSRSDRRRRRSRPSTT